MQTLDNTTKTLSVLVPCISNFRNVTLNISKCIEPLNDQLNLDYSKYFLLQRRNRKNDLMLRFTTYSINFNLWFTMTVLFKNDLTIPCTFVKFFIVEFEG